MMTPRHDDAPGHGASRGLRAPTGSDADRQAHGSAHPGPVHFLSSTTGGYRWRKAKGLLTWRDHARRWRALRFVPIGARAPLPESLLPVWLERSV